MAEARSPLQALPAPVPAPPTSGVLAGGPDIARQLLDLELELELELTAAADSPREALRLYRAELAQQAQELRDSQTRTEAALAWSSSLFRLLPMAALLVDAQGQIIDANEQAMDEFGLREALRVLPVPLRRLMADTHTELRVNALLPTLATGHAVGLDDVAMRTLGGAPRWADLRMTLMQPRVRGSEPPMRLCVLNDRTARVESQRLREAARHAEHARDVALTADRAKTQLLSRVSHELRTPLNAVLGFSHLVLHGRDPLPPEVARRVRHIADAGQQLLELVDEVLELNRAEAGLVPLELEAVPLAPLLDQVLALQEPMLAAAGLALRRPEGPLPAVRADGRRLRQVLTNLVGNAVKYNRPGGWVAVELMHRPPEGDQPARAELVVADGGIGLSAEQLEHLFEPFNRLGAEQLGIAGHGLGLCIARTLVQAMGGSLDVRAEPGQGSRFSISLPLAG